MAASLVSQFTNQGDVVYDPFSGSGTVVLEAWAAGNHAIGNDLNPYAALLTRSKLFPYGTFDAALKDIESVATQVGAIIQRVDLRRVPQWVRLFFHPDTLREVLAWTSILSERGLSFLLACLMGILHHQRPGFLSYPSSHTVPYLREKKFPRRLFPDMYCYRPLRDRLEAKVKRALTRVPQLDFKFLRESFSQDAAFLNPGKAVDAIITSPPYMRQLDYGRDNRLRLWFLGVSDWTKLDSLVSLGEAEFIGLLRRCLIFWKSLLSPTGRCVLVLGDSFSRLYQAPLPTAIAKVATEEVTGYAVIAKYTEKIPDLRRVRRGLLGNQFESVLVLNRSQ